MHHRASSSKNKPSWYPVSSDDRMIPPETQAWMAERIQARKTIALQASHASLASRAADVAALIDDTARALG